MGRTRGARYKYKIIICYKQKNLYCTSLTHIHKNTIYTERLGGAGALQGGGRRCCSPASPPTRASSSLRRRGLHQQRSSHRKSHAKLARGVRTRRGWSGPSAATLLPRGRGRRRRWRGGERAGARGSLANPQSAWGLQTLGAKLGPERNFLPCRPRGGRFFGPGGSLVRHFCLGVGVNGGGRQKGADGAVHVAPGNAGRRSQGGPSWTRPGHRAERTGELRPRLSLSVKLPAASSPSPFRPLSPARATGAAWNTGGRWRGTSRRTEQQTGTR